MVEESPRNLSLLKRGNNDGLKPGIPGEHGEEGRGWVNGLGGEIREGSDVGGGNCSIKAA